MRKKHQNGSCFQTDNPPTPPSLSAKADSDKAKLGNNELTLQTWIDSIKQLFNLSFAASSIAMGGILGKYNTLNIHVTHASNHLTL